MRILMTIFYRIARVYWRIFRPKTFGARLLLINDNKVLLVKHTYQNSYYLPGGGVKFGEDFKEAVHRELAEELGLEIKNMELFGEYQSTKEGKRDTIGVFISKQIIDIEKLSLNSNEVEKVVMVDIDNLPVNTASGTKKRIDEYRTKSYPSTGLW